MTAMSPLEKPRRLSWSAADVSGSGLSESGRARKARSATGISSSEAEVIRLFSQGLTVAAIAYRLDISERTVRRRMSNACARLGVSTSIEAVVVAVRSGII
jgi:DNA-binding NarL/FixJ family response regulator